MNSPKANGEDREALTFQGALTRIEGLVQAAVTTNTLTVTDSVVAGDSDKLMPVVIHTPTPLDDTVQYRSVHLNDQLLGFGAIAGGNEYVTQGLTFSNFSPEELEELRDVTKEHVTATFGGNEPGPHGRVVVEEWLFLTDEALEFVKFEAPAPSAKVFAEERLDYLRSEAGTDELEAALAEYADEREQSMDTCGLFPSFEGWLFTIMEDGYDDYIAEWSDHPLESQRTITQEEILKRLIAKLPLLEPS